MDLTHLYSTRWGRLWLDRPKALLWARDNPDIVRAAAAQCHMRDEWRAVFEAWLDGLGYAGAARKTKTSKNTAKMKVIKALRLALVRLQNDTPDTPLECSSLSTRVANSLLEHGFRTIEDVRRVVHGYEDIKELKTSNFSKGSMEEVARFFNVPIPEKSRPCSPSREKRLLLALHDAINSPRGVMPDTAAEFYDQSKRCAAARSAV